MALSGKIESESYTAGADLSTSRYKVVKKDSSGDTVTVCTTPNAGVAAGPIGVLQIGAASTRAVAVGISGETKVVGGDTVTAGKYLSVNSAGHAVHASSGDVVFARAQEAGTDENLFRATLLTPFILVGAN